MSLRAPIAVTVEVRAAGRRVFRLAANLGEDGLALERPAPFERGRPVEINFALPDGGERLRLDARVETGGDDDQDEDAGRQGPAGGRELTFLSIGPEERGLLRAYVIERLGLPEPPG
ncbi:MAG TPA: PilZ domain-containing protein [Polyangia bacterium]|nr:PilZ domain-containing protein [Polyangia bacterium]